MRHRSVLLGAGYDILGGAQALSEIDFVRLCRRARLPAPEQQRVRPDSAGRRRYLDASWRLPDGRLLVAEVDGALHISARRWWDDQLRQNELAVGGATVLRFLLRCCEPSRSWWWPNCVERSDRAIFRRISRRRGVRL